MAGISVHAGTRMILLGTLDDSRPDKWVIGIRNGEQQAYFTGTGPARLLSTAKDLARDTDLAGQAEQAQQADEPVSQVEFPPAQAVPG